MIKHVITGGPGSGKSALIKVLGENGFPTIKEAAKEIIFKEKKRGVPEPWLDKFFPDFQRKIFEEQLRREAEIPLDTKIVFIDRGIPDSLAYYKYKQFKPPQKLLDAVNKCKYEKVFFLKPLPLYRKTKYRVEDEEEAKEISKIIRKTYENLGYHPIIIPAVSIKERVNIILKNI